MKFALFAILLVTPALTFAADKPNPADYTINVHVQSAQLSSPCVTDIKGFCISKLWLDILIDGKKIELQDQKPGNAVLHVGDYKARIFKEDTSKSYQDSRIYEFLFPDGTTRRYIMVGESE